MDDADLAASLVLDAGRLAARMLTDGVSVDYKTSITDVVSAADHAAEELVVSRLGSLRPEDALVGEEGTSRPGTSGRTWYVDPVDGTYNFVCGLPVWCSAVARDLDVGAVFQPALETLWVGGAATPTTIDGAAVGRLAERPLNEISVCTYLHPTTLPDDSLREPLTAVMGGAATVRMLGSGSIELACVASGRIGLSVQSNSLPWDWLPGAALVIGAGGAAEVIEHRGHRWHVAGNRRAVDEAINLLTSA